MFFVLFLSDDHRTRGSGLAPWPARLTAPSPRLADFGYSSEMWEKDMVILRPNISFLSLCLSMCSLVIYLKGLCTSVVYAQQRWQRRVENYWNLLSPKISSDTLRNVMDMKANMGSFGAALKDKNVWVMNVVPEDGPNTLKLVYDRGLIGTIHNWYATELFRSFHKF